MPPDDGQVVAEELQRNDVDDRLEGINRLGDLRDAVGRKSQGREVCEK